MPVSIPTGETWINNGLTPPVTLPGSTLTVPAADTATGAVIVAATLLAPATDVSNPQSYSTTIEVMQIQITGSSSVTAGNSIPLTVQVNPGSVALQSVTWLVDNPALASISPATSTSTPGQYSGTLTAGTTAGTVNVTFQITLNDGDVTTLTSSQFPVTILPVHVTKITVAGPTSLTHGGNTYNYTATVTPANATNPGVTWSWTKVGSSHLSPTLTSTGPDSVTLTTDSSHTGTITITATAEDGSGVSGTTQNITIN